MDPNTSGSPIEISTIINSLISLTALSVAIYSLYLQRRDKKPRLTVEAELGVRKITVSSDSYGGHTLLNDFALIITLRNSTEKDIQVESIYFARKGSYAGFKLEPWNKRLPVVLSHKSSEIIIPIEQLVRAFGAKEKGKASVRVNDVLGNTSSSPTEFYDPTDIGNYFASYSDQMEWVREQAAQKELREREDS